MVRLGCARKGFELQQRALSAGLACLVLMATRSNLRFALTQLLNLPMYAHVVTLNELVAAKLWLPKKVFLAPANANSWQLCENKRAPIYHYTKDSETWRCRVCRTHTPNRKTTRCLNGHATRIVRQASGDDSCSSYDRESSVADSSTIDSSSSSDSSEENDCGLEDDNCSVVVIDTVSMSEGIGDSSSFT